MILGMAYHSDEHQKVHSQVSKCFNTFDSFYVLKILFSQLTQTTKSGKETHLRVSPEKGPNEKFYFCVKNHYLKYLCQTKSWELFTMLFAFLCQYILSYWQN